MRSQATKSVPKKVTPTKTSLKTSKNDKRKSLTNKKVRKLVKKNLVKAPKNSVLKESSTDDDGISENDLKTSLAIKTSTVKKNKVDAKDKKQKSLANLTKKTEKNIKKPSGQVQPENKKKSILNKKEDDDVKYKINSQLAKTNPKFSKAKTVVKRKIVQKKKSGIKNTDTPDNVTENVENLENVSKEKSPEKISKGDCVDKVGNEKIEQSKMSDTSRKSSTSTNPGSISLSPPKFENDRPHKFFTSARSPRTMDIDVKSYKITKHLSNSDRLSNMKNTSNEICKEKNSLQSPEIDVYTFSEKVDSPKSILLDFQNPPSKTVGRVRPIARVKGTIIDKNKDGEKKKYSPHRPIEEVVKQLKANKKPEELKASETVLSNTITSEISNVLNNQDVQEKTKVGKSYTMVNRKRIPGCLFSPVAATEQERPQEIKPDKSVSNTNKSKKKFHKKQISDEEIETSTFSLNTKSKIVVIDSSADESVNDSNDDNKDSESEPLRPKAKNKKYKKVSDLQRNKPSKELMQLTKDDDSNPEKTSKRRRKLISMWEGPKKHRMASLNALAKVHCLYENESRTHVELGLMKTVPPTPSTSTKSAPQRKKKETVTLIDVKDIKKERLSTSESEYEQRDKYTVDSSEDDSSPPPQSTRKLRGIPGIRSAGKYWDPKSCTSSSEESELESRKDPNSGKKKSFSKPPPVKSDTEKPPSKEKAKSISPVAKKKRNRNEVVMDLKDMVVQKRMASLNATAILAASYEKRSPKSSKDDTTTSDSCSDESFCQVPKNGLSSGVKSEAKVEEPKKEKEEELSKDKKQKVEVIVNQDTDVTITGVYATHHHEGFCTVAGMQYRISSTSHTQTTATSNCEKEGCTKEEGARYTPLTALSSMQPPAEHAAHDHPVAAPELGGLTRRAAGCSSAFTAPPPPATHHEPGYYQPAGPLIKESSDAERPLARYHPQPHYHAPHAPQYGPYYPDLCYGRYYRPPGPYHVPPPPNPESQMMGPGSEPYPPQFYGGPPCYQHSSQRVPYLEYRCPCPMNSCSKNVLIGPATGKAPASGGPAELNSSLAPPRGVFRSKVRAACALDMGADTHGSGKDPPSAIEPEQPAKADAPQPLSGASPKRELLYDARDSPRLAGDTPGPAEAVGPPSPARGSAGICAPQPPPVAPRRARLGKAMARRSLADTGSLLTSPAPLPPPNFHSDADDDVLAISPPACVPIDLSSSDETDRRSTPLFDVKKENDGPTVTSPRKSDALALREHNSTEPLVDTPVAVEVGKPVKRRYSKPKLEIDILDVNLQDGCKTNGIGEHVKLQKRRKIMSEPSDLSRNNNNNKEKISKKKCAPKTKSTPKIQSPLEKKTQKRRNVSILNLETQTKVTDIEVAINKDVAMPVLSVPKSQDKEQLLNKPKTKSALVLDNLIRKNSVDAKNYNSDDNINPAELFLSPTEHCLQNDIKKSLNINNNIVNNNNGVRPKTLAAVTQLINKKLSATKTIDPEISESHRIESNITHTLVPVKTVLKTTEQVSSKEDSIKIKDSEIVQGNKTNMTKVDKAPKQRKINISKNKISTITDKLMSEAISDKSQKRIPSTDRLSNTSEVLYEAKSLETDLPKQDDIQSTEFEPVQNKVKDTTPKADKAKRLRPTQLQLKEKSKRSKLTAKKSKKKHKVRRITKLFVAKKFAIKIDEPTLVVEEASCSSIMIPNTAVKRTRRRRSATIKKHRRVRHLVAPPLTEISRLPPRWCNGWSWGGKNFLSTVFINNDQNLDRMARCWTRMTHMSGDRLTKGDCVLLRPTSARAQPFVAKIANLWENPDDGEMMVSLVWYYRPEHTESGRQEEDAPDEVFASRHRDANSVACIEDKCYVLQYNEYCRYRKRLKAIEEGINMVPSIVPPMPESEVTPQIATHDSKMPLTVSPELVLFCRKVYDFRNKKICWPAKCVIPPQ